MRKCYDLDVHISQKKSRGRGCGVLLSNAVNLEMVSIRTGLARIKNKFNACLPYCIAVILTIK